MDPSIAFLSQGKLFVKLAGQDVKEIDSAFARQAMERQVRSQERDGWKARGGLWGSMGLGQPDLGQWQTVEGLRRCHFHALAPAEKKGELLYVVDIGSAGGLFHYNVASDVERRLMHRNDFTARDLARHPQHGTLAVSLRQGDGTACLAVSENEGRHLSNVTSGDSVDESPSWVPDTGRKLVFQSAGIGRNEAGLPLGLAPYTIELLDMEGKDIRTLARDDSHDLLAPHQTATGELYFIRRPYRPQGHARVDPYAMLMDVVLFPYRVLRAIVYFLHFFSLVFSGQPLMTAGGPKRIAPDTRYLALWGHVIDTKRAMQRSGREKETNLVPKDWELVCRNADGTDRVLANSVLSYDLGQSGEVVYTNGTAVFHLDAEGNKRTLCEGRLIEQLTVLT